jgi:DNA invertase Pin-like site-specific DNA recombinase
MGHVRDTLSRGLPEPRHRFRGVRLQGLAERSLLAELEKALGLSPVHALDGRWVDIIDRVHKRGALVKVLDRDYLNLTKPINRGILAFLSALAEDERHHIVKRANDGSAAARKRGVQFGRKLKLSEHQQAEALRRMAAGESCGAIAKTFGVHHATVARLAA